MTFLQCCQGSERWNPQRWGQRVRQNARFSRGEFRTFHSTHWEDGIVRVLLIGREVRLAEAIARELQTEEITVDCAYDGAEGLLKARDRHEVAGKERP